MKKHLKRLAIPRSWPIPKKSNVFITRPSPTRSMEFSIPLNMVFRDILKTAKTAKEVKHLLMNNYVFVNGVQVKDIKKVLGLMDVLEIKGTNEAYRMLLDTQGKLVLVKIKESEAKIRPSKLIGKSLLPKGKVQLNFMNGFNIIVEKDSYKVGDVLVLEMPNKKIREHFPLEKGAQIFLFGGNYIGQSGSLVEMDERTVVIKSGKNEFKTSKDYIFVVGKDKPSINLNVE